MEGETDPLQIAIKELKEKKIPLVVRRYLPDGWYCFPLVIDLSDLTDLCFQVRRLDLRRATLSCCNHTLVFSEAYRKGGFLRALACKGDLSAMASMPYGQDVLRSRRKPFYLCSRIS